MAISHTSNCKLKITSLEIKKLNLFNKCILLLMNVWVQFFVIIFYYNSLILWFDLLRKIFNSSIALMYSWLENKMSSTLALEDGLEVLTIEVWWISDYMLVRNSLFFKYSLSSKICSVSSLSLDLESDETLIN